MNLPGFSSAIQAPSMPISFPSFGAISTSGSSSVSRCYSSGCIFSASRSEGLGSVSPSIRLTDNAGKKHVRSQQTMSFKCAAFGDGDGEPDTGIKSNDNLLVSGSPIVIVEAPVMLKTAEPMPMMRPNGGVIKPGDAGRVIARRPKGLWAVRFAVGAYLIERKCFKPLEVQ